MIGAEALAQLMKANGGGIGPEGLTIQVTAEGMKLEKAGEGLGDVSTKDLRSRYKDFEAKLKIKHDMGVHSKKNATGRELQRRGIAMAKSGLDALEDHLQKAGPYIGPKGGKWKDPKHTVPWKEGGKEPKGVESLVEKLKSPGGFDPVMKHLVSLSVEQLKGYGQQINEAAELPIMTVLANMIRSATLVVKRKGRGQKRVKGEMTLTLEDISRLTKRLSMVPKAEVRKRLVLAEKQLVRVNEELDEHPGGKGFLALGKKEKGLTLAIRRLNNVVGMKKSMSEHLEKAGPFIGPKGGKWQDPQHKIPWEKEKAHTAGAGKPVDHTSTKAGTPKNYAHWTEADHRKAVEHHEKAGVESFSSQHHIAESENLVRMHKQLAESKTDKGTAYHKTTAAKARKEVLRAQKEIKAGAGSREVPSGGGIIEKEAASKIHAWAKKTVEPAHVRVTTTEMLDAAMGRTKSDPQTRKQVHEILGLSPEQVTQKEQHLAGFSKVEHDMLHMQPGAKVLATNPAEAATHFGTTEERIKKLWDTFEKQGLYERVAKDGEEWLVRTKKKPKLLGHQNDKPVYAHFKKSTTSMSGLEALEDHLQKAEKIPGGQKAADFDPKALAAGTKVEAEHTKDSAKAAEIAKDHLTEDPKYYEKLARMEKSGPGELLEKAGPFIGPKGGKWADSKHTIPWHGGDKTKQMRSKLETMREANTGLRADLEATQARVAAKKKELAEMPESMHERVMKLKAKIKKVKAATKKIESGLGKSEAQPSEKTDITPEKARKILHDGEVGGKPLTEQQRKFFGAIGGHLPAPGKKTEKSMSGIDALEEHLSKAGEGSRGGKVVGHTAAGKPIYAKDQQDVKQKFIDEYLARFKGKVHKERAKEASEKKKKKEEETRQMIEKDTATRLKKIKARHKKAGMMKKSGIEALEEHLEKSMVGGHGMDWAGRMGGSPFEVEALQCVKDLNACQQERAEIKKHGKPWSAEERMDPVERAKLRQKRDKMHEKIDTKEDAVRKKMGEVEEKYLDWRIEQAKKMEKSGIEALGEHLSKAGPFVGPKGGKWADSKHTVPWKEGGGDKGPKKPIQKLLAARDKLRSRLSGSEPNTPKERAKEQAAEEALRQFDTAHPEVVEAHVERHRAGTRRFVQEAKKMKKSGIDQLEEHLEKSVNTIETGTPSMTPSVNQGAPLEGVGKPTGSPPTSIGKESKDKPDQGKVTDLKVKGGADWSLDDEARRIFDGLGGTMKKGHSVDHDRAIAVARLRNGPEAVHPFRMSVTHGGADVVLSKGYANDNNPANAIINKTVLCKSCGKAHTAMLTACPGCGTGTVMQESLGKSAVGFTLTDSRGAPLLQPRRREPDVVF